MNEPFKKARDCDCACHREAAVIHVVPCCDAFVPAPTKPKKDTEPASPRDK